MNAFASGALALLLCLPLAARTLTYEGILLNQNDWSGNFPEGATFTLSFDLDDSLPPSPNDFYAQYNNHLSNPSLSVPASGFSVSGTVFNDGQWIISRGATLNEPIVEGRLPILTGSPENDVTVTLRFYQNFGAPPTGTSLTQPFDTTAFRLIDITFESQRPGSTGKSTAGFGWLLPHPVSSAPSAPDPVKPDGHRAITGLGDSLSAAKNPDFSESDADTYFDEGYTNGPVWVQYLSWLMGLEYREGLNYSQFGGFDLPDPEDLADLPFAGNLAVQWSNTEILLGIWEYRVPAPGQWPVLLSVSTALPAKGIFRRYGGGKGRGKEPGFTPQPATLEGFDVPLRTTRFPNQFDAPGGLQPGLGGYHAWQSRDMKTWVHHGPVTEGCSRWVTSTELVDGGALIYYDFPNDQDPHWKKENPENYTTNVADYEIHEPEQEASRASRTRSVASRRRWMSPACRPAMGSRSS